MTAILRSFGELVTFLNQNGVPNGAVMGDHVVELPVTIPPLEDIVHVRWEKIVPYLQLICVMVRDVPPDRNHEVEIACCRANNPITFPGFGFDYTRRSVYFRHTHVMSDGIEPAFLQKLVLSVASNARDFLVPFRRVVGEGQPGERIVDLAVEFAQANTPGTSQPRAKA